MSEILQFLETTFQPLVLLFTVSNLFAMGLQAKMPEVIAALKNKKSLALIFVWGWVLGPALGYLITRVIPLAEPYAITLLLSSLAPCAPFLQQMVGKGKGDPSFAGAFIPLVMVGTVVFMPLMAPLLIEGLTVSTGVLALPFIITLLLPLIIGAAARHYAEIVATKIFPAVKKFAGLMTFVMIVVLLVLHGRAMLDMAGSLALLSMTVFMVVMGLITYRFGFGLKQNHRSVMSLGMLTRNFTAVFIAYLAMPDADPRILTMIVMWILWSIALAAIAARLFAKRALLQLIKGQ